MLPCIVDQNGDIVQQQAAHSALSLIVGGVCLCGGHAASLKGERVLNSLCYILQGIGIEETLEEIVRRIPAPNDTAEKPLRALIFDSHYDSYKVHTSHGAQSLNMLSSVMTCKKAAKHSA